MWTEFCVCSGGFDPGMSGTPYPTQRSDNIFYLKYSFKAHILSAMETIHASLHIGG